MKEGCSCVICSMCASRTAAVRRDDEVHPTWPILPLTDEKDMECDRRYELCSCASRVRTPVSLTTGSCSSSADRLTKRHVRSTRRHTRALLALAEERTSRSSGPSQEWLRRAAALHKTSSTIVAIECETQIPRQRRPTPWLLGPSSALSVLLSTQIPRQRRPKRWSHGPSGALSAPAHVGLALPEANAPVARPNSA
eukprot:Amastigsp_a842633_145.p2 type:complete len:196 gc:universal Amastigsp_a842633_145:1958-1371(-)